MLKPKLYQLLLLLIAVALLVACGGETTNNGANTGNDNANPPINDGNNNGNEGETPTTDTSTEPSVVRIGWAGSPDTLNLGVAVLAEAYTIAELVYDSMYQLNLDGTYSLEAAESVLVSDDGLTYTYKIRNNITWHDGEPMTAQDIAFSYNLYRDQADYPFLNIYTGYFDTIEAKLLEVA